MKSYLIETYKDAIIFPLLGVGFQYSIRRSTFGFGVQVIRSIVGKIILIGIGITIEFRGAGLNSKVYRQKAKEQYFKRRNK